MPSGTRRTTIAGGMSSAALRATELLLLAVLLVVPTGWSPAHAHPDLDALERASGSELASRPDDPGLNLQQALIYRVAHKWTAALDALDHAREHGADPDVVGATRGQVLLEAGRPDEAWRELDRVVAQKPAAYAVLFDRGRAALACGRKEDAQRDFAEALAGLPEPRPEQVFALRDVLLALGKHDEAIRALDAGVARLGPVVSLHLAALDIELERKRSDDALRRIDALLELEPRNESWIVRRGEILEKAGRRDEARAAYAHALAVIGERPAQQRGRRIVALQARLETALAAAPRSEEGPK